MSDSQLGDNNTKYIRNKLYSVSKTHMAIPVAIFEPSQIPSRLRNCYASTLKTPYLRSTYIFMEEKECKWKQIVSWGSLLMNVFK